MNEQRFLNQNENIILIDFIFSKSALSNFDQNQNLT